MLQLPFSPRTLPRAAAAAFRQILAIFEPFIFADAIIFALLFTLSHIAAFAISFDALDIFSGACYFSPLSPPCRQALPLLIESADMPELIAFLSSPAAAIFATPLRRHIVSLSIRCRRLFFFSKLRQRHWLRRRCLARHDFRQRHFDAERADAIAVACYAFADFRLAFFRRLFRHWLFRRCFHID
jgi:hypothetical protein